LNLPTNREMTWAIFNKIFKTYIKDFVWEIRDNKLLIFVYSKYGRKHTHHSMESIYRGRRKAIKTPPTNIEPLKKKGSSFGKHVQLRKQRDALDWQIEMIEALTSLVSSSSIEGARWYGGFGSLVDSNSVEVHENSKKNSNVGIVDKGKRSC
jgi:hypothetical protein